MKNEIEGFTREKGAVEWCGAEEGGIGRGERQ